MQATAVTTSTDVRSELPTGGGSAAPTGSAPTGSTDPTGSAPTPRTKPHRGRIGHRSPGTPMYTQSCKPENRRESWTIRFTPAANITHVAGMIAIHLAYHYGDPDGSHMFPSQAHIATELGLCEETVSRAIRELEDAGWLVVRRSRPVRDRCTGQFISRPTNRYYLSTPGAEVDFEPRRESRQRKCGPPMCEIEAIRRRRRAEEAAAAAAVAEAEREAALAAALEKALQVIPEPGHRAYEASQDPAGVPQAAPETMSSSEAIAAARALLARPEDEDQPSDITTAARRRARLERAARAGSP